MPLPTAPANLAITSCCQGAGVIEALDGNIGMGGGKVVEANDDDLVPADGTARPTASTIDLRNLFMLEVAVPSELSLRTGRDVCEVTFGLVD